MDLFSFYYSLARFTGKRLQRFFRKYSMYVRHFKFRIYSKTCAAVLITYEFYEATWFDMAQ